MKNNFKSCPICEQELFSDLGKGCKLCGMPLIKNKDFCCKDCLKKYGGIHEVN